MRKINILGRKSNASNATIGIVTTDKSMSREHIRIEVKEYSFIVINLGITACI